MATPHPYHAGLTAAAKLSLERIRNRWVDAHAMGAEPNPYFYDGQAKGIFDLWCEATGVTAFSQDWVALDKLVKAITATKGQASVETTVNNQQLNYAQITAATHRVIAREAERCQRELKMDRKYARVEVHQNIAYGALALWEELTTGQPKQDDRLQFNGMLDDIGKPEAKR